MQEVRHAIKKRKKKGSNNKCTFSREGPQNIDLIRLKKALNWKKNKKEFRGWHGIQIVNAKKIYVY